MPLQHFPKEEETGLVERFERFERAVHEFKVALDALEGWTLASKPHQEALISLCTEVAEKCHASCKATMSTQRATRVGINE